ncbi:hypothetical protein MRX96_024602 [Rhipicephalus microplus]
MATHAGPPIFDEGDDKWEAYQVEHLASLCKPNPHQENAAHCEEPSSDNEDYGQFLLHLRQLQAPVTYAGKTVNATLVVLGCSGPNLCGRDIYQAFQLTGGPVLNVDVNVVVNDGSLPRRHSAGEPIWCENYGAGASWRPTVIQTTRVARLSTVKTEDGELCECHED